MNFGEMLSLIPEFWWISDLGRQFGHADQMQRSKHISAEVPLRMNSHDTKLRNKLDETKRKGCEMTEESLRATNEMLRLILQCEHAGASTLATIHAQGEQLNKAEAGLDTIHGGLNQAGDDLREIERGESRYCWCCPNCCYYFRSSKEKEAEVWETGRKSPAVTKQPKSHLLRKQRHGVGNGPHIIRITHDKAEDQMDQNLQGVSQGLGVLKNTAIGMNVEVSKQNTQIDVMNVKASSNNSKLDSETKRTKDLLKR